MEKFFKEIKDKHPTGNDYVPGDVTKLMGENSLEITTHLIKNIYETGKWTKISLKIKLLP